MKVLGLRQDWLWLYFWKSLLKTSLIWSASLSCSTRHFDNHCVHRINVLLDSDSWGTSIIPSLKPIVNVFEQSPIVLLLQCLIDECPHYFWMHTMLVKHIDSYQNVSILRSKNVWVFIDQRACSSIDLWCWYFHLDWWSKSSLYNLRLLLGFWHSSHSHRSSVLSSRCCQCCWTTHSFHRLLCILASFAVFMRRKVLVICWIVCDNVHIDSR